LGVILGCRVEWKVGSWREEESAIMITIKIVIGQLSACVYEALTAS